MENAGRITFFIVSNSLSHSEIYTDDIVNKSVLFRITETSCCILMSKKTEERFLIKKKPRKSCWVKKGKIDA